MSNPDNMTKLCEELKNKGIKIIVFDDGVIFSRPTTNPGRKDEKYTGDEAQWISFLQNMIKKLLDNNFKIVVTTLKLSKGEMKKEHMKKIDPNNSIINIYFYGAEDDEKKYIDDYNKIHSPGENYTHDVDDFYIITTSRIISDGLSYSKMGYFGPNYRLVQILLKATVSEMICVEPYHLDYAVGQYNHAKITYGDDKEYKMVCTFIDRKIYNFTNYPKYSSTAFIVVNKTQTVIVIEKNDDQLFFAKCLQKTYKDPKSCFIFVLTNSFDAGNHRIIELIAN